MCINRFTQKAHKGYSVVIIEKNFYLIYMKTILKYFNEFEKSSIKILFQGRALSLSLGINFHQYFPHLQNSKVLQKIILILK